MSDNRNIPPFKSKEEMLDILQREEYGYLPPKPDSISYRAEKDVIENFCAGKANLNKVYIDVSLNEKHFEIPFYTVIPKGKDKVPFFVFISFSEDVNNKYCPVEEIIDNGFALMHMCYNDVTKDDGDFTDGLASVIFKDGKRDETAPGKIALWAWAAQRVLDYAYTIPNLNHQTAMVCGHSRLGKTALLAGATDERFKFVFSNDSGCSGAAISRGKCGEHIKDIIERFDYWFSPSYKKYVEKENEMPFDQHYLLSAIAPRYLYVSSAEEDLWADPESEFLNCHIADEAYKVLGLKGFEAPEKLPEAPARFHEGNIGYHIRRGTHYFSRYDWNEFMKFYTSKEEQK